MACTGIHDAPQAAIDLVKVGAYISYLTLVTTYLDLDPLHIWLCHYFCSGLAPVFLHA